MAGMSGLRHSPQTKDRISKAKLANPTRYWLGKKRDPETNAKISTSKRGKPNPGAGNADNFRRSVMAQRRPVVCLDFDRTYPSAVDAAKEVGGNYRTLHGQIRRGGAFRGLHFKYVE